MNRIRIILRLAGVAGVLLAFSAISPAAFASRTPPFGGLIERGNPPPAVHTIVVGGMPGWQITLIAAATAIFTAALAVILDHARAARAAGGSARPVTWADSSPRAAPRAAITARPGMLDVLDTFGTAGAGRTAAASRPRARALRGERAHRAG